MDINSTRMFLVNFYVIKCGFESTWVLVEDYELWIWLTRLVKKIRENVTIVFVHPMASFWVYFRIMFESTILLS